MALASTARANGMQRAVWEGLVIVCLGWGSLIWCQKTLPVAGMWQADGPDLPVEFARESGGKRITLVICEGRPAVTVLWASLAVESLDGAKQALASREGVQPKHVSHSIGYWSIAGRSDHAEASAIGQWATEHGFDGVVWTALKPEMGNEYRVPAQDEVIGYLNALTGGDRDGAEEYVRLAPRQIVTPYRAAIEAQLAGPRRDFYKRAQRRAFRVYRGRPCFLAAPLRTELTSVGVCHLFRYRSGEAAKGKTGELPMDEVESESGQPPTFMSTLAQRLGSEDGADTALTAILKEHILVDAAAPDAVVKAKAAIIALATARATPAVPVDEASDG